MNQYKQLKDKQCTALNNFFKANGFFAFSEKQYQEGKEKINFKQGVDKLIQLPGNGFILSNKINELNKLQQDHENELEAAMQDNDFLYDAFKYELNNHEYCYSYDNDTPLAMLNLTLSEVESDPRLNSIFNKAKNDYINYCRKEGY